MKKTIIHQGKFSQPLLDLNGIEEYRAILDPEYDRIVVELKHSDILGNPSWREASEIGMKCFVLERIILEKISAQEKPLPSDQSRRHDPSSGYYYK